MNVRDWSGKNPVRIILDRNNVIDKNYYIKDEKIKTIVITEQENILSSENCIYENAIFDFQLTKAIVHISYKYGLQSILIEGGKQTLQAFIDDTLWDEARVFVGTIYLKSGIKAPVLNENFQLKNIKKDQLKLYFNHD